MTSTTRRPSVAGIAGRLGPLLAALLIVGGCSSAAPSSSGSPTPFATIATLATPAITPGATLTPAIVTVTPIAGAPDSGVIVNLVIDNVRWSVSTIRAPAEKVWHVEIDNRDGLTEQHNFVVASGPAFAQRIYTSATFKTGMFSFDIPALPAGAYLFICTTHPTVMTGTLTLG
jgi:hypothetical protein